MADLSNWYLDVIKDRLYVSAADSFDRRAAQTVLHSLVQACVLPHLLACLLCTSSCAGIASILCFLGMPSMPPNCTCL